MALNDKLWFIFSIPYFTNAQLTGLVQLFYLMRIPSQLSVGFDIYLEEIVYLSIIHSSFS